MLTKRQYTNKDVIDDRYGRLWELPMALARQGHTVTCVCLSYRFRSAGAKTYTGAAGEQVRWISVNLGKTLVIGLWQFWQTLQRTLRADHPDVIWSCSDTLYTVLGDRLARKFACRSVADLYDNFEYFGSYRLPPLRRQYRRVVRDTDGVSCVSEALQAHIRQDYRRVRRTAVITNAIDSAVFKPMPRADCRAALGLPAQEILVGTAGDLSHYRGTDTLYELMRNPPAALSNVRLVVAGFRDHESAPPRGAIDLGQLAPEQVPLLLNSLDVVVVYNRSSSFGDYCFPQKLYEALACEVPVVAADVGELSRIFAQQSELLYADGDPRSLGRALQGQLQQPRSIAAPVPTWSDQGLLLQELMHAVLSET